MTLNCSGCSHRESGDHESGGQYNNYVNIVSYSVQNYDKITLTHGAGFSLGGVAAASFLVGTAFGACVLITLLYIKKKKVCDRHCIQKNDNKLELSENMAYEIIRLPTSTPQVIQ